MTKKKEPEKTVPQGEVYRPMAVQEPTPLERLEAVEIKIKVLEDRISQHNKYHFGKST